MEVKEDSETRHSRWHQEKGQVLGRLGDNMGKETEEEIVRIEI